MSLNIRHHYRRNKYQWNFILGGLIIALALFITAVVYTQWPWYFLWLITINLVSFIFFGLDKIKAKRHSRVRIPEVVLHAFGLLGGFIGSMVGMLIFRHKTNFSEHPWFMVVITSAAVLHGLFLWYVYL